MPTFFIVLLLIVALIIVFALYWQKKKEADYYAYYFPLSQADLEKSNKQNQQLHTEAKKLQAEVTLLAPYRVIVDAERHARQIREKTEEYQAKAKQEKTKMDALLAAVRNKVVGYGEDYFIPQEEWLDALAEKYSFKKVGEQLKATREQIKQVLKEGKATLVDAVPTNHPHREREQQARNAISFLILDAFNEKMGNLLKSIKSDNIGTIQQRIRDAATLVDHWGQSFHNARISTNYVNLRLAEAKWACAARTLEEQAKQEQRELQANAREEEKARRDFEKALKDTEKEERRLEKSLAETIRKMEGAKQEEMAAYQGQIAQLEALLKAAEDKNKRALSMAQQTKRGYVYIISNIGSLGENIYKIGMTRRLDPLDRIKELSDASVPFGFDIHAMIFSEDAPQLEATLHREFHDRRVNKINMRKEFFAVGLSDVKTIIVGMKLEVTWTLAAEAREYRETQAKIAATHQAAA